MLAHDIPPGTICSPKANVKLIGKFPQSGNSPSFRRRRTIIRALRDYHSAAGGSSFERSETCIFPQYMLQ